MPLKDLPIQRKLMTILLLVTGITLRSEEHTSELQSP